MSDSVDKAKDVVHAVEHPVETAKALEDYQAKKRAHKAEMRAKQQP